MFHRAGEGDGGGPTCGVSRHLNDTSALSLHLSGAEGPDPHSHLHGGSRHGSVSLETSPAKRQVRDPGSPAAA